MSNQNTPDVTVIVCAYRIGERIRPTIDAILGQTYRNLKLIVIDDASGDDTPNVVRSYDDDRLELVVNQENLGIIRARNLGLSLAETEYVATCDHDDVWLPDKLEKQISHMRAHPKCALVGSYWTVYVNGKLDGTRSLPFISSSFLKWYLYHKNCLLHSSLLMRCEHIKNYNIEYQDGLRFADDWQLCLDFAETGDIAIIPESLVNYYIHGENWSLHARGTMHGSGILVLKNNLEKLLGTEISADDAELYFLTIADGNIPACSDELERVGALLKAIADACCRKVDKETHRQITSEASKLWWHVVKSVAGKLGPAYLSIYSRDNTPNHIKISRVGYIVQWMKCLLKYVVGQNKRGAA